MANLHFGRNIGILFFFNNFFILLSQLHVKKIITTKTLNIHDDTIVQRYKKSVFFFPREGKVWVPPPNCLSLRVV